MDINTSPNSQSQSKRINMTLLDFSVWQIWAVCVLQHVQMLQPAAWVIVNLMLPKTCPMVVGVLTLLSFSPWIKARITSCPLSSWWDVLELSVLSQKHCLLETTWVTGQLLTCSKKILVAKGQHYIQNLLITSRQRSKSKTKNTQTSDRKPPKGKLFHLFTSIWSRY